MVTKTIQPVIFVSITVTISEYFTPDSFPMARHL
jgi:hypothetical protein